MKKFKVELKAELLFLNIEAKDKRHASGKALARMRNVILENDDLTITVTFGPDWEEDCQEIG